MTGDQLTALLAERVMRWGVAPDRYTMGNRGWMPRWRFQPTEKLEDALRLLREAAPQEYSICGDEKGVIQVWVRVGARTGTAAAGTMASAIATAVARAVGLDVPEDPQPVGTTKDGVTRAPRSRSRGK